MEGSDLAPPELVDTHEDKSTRGEDTALAVAGKRPSLGMAFGGKLGLWGGSDAGSDGSGGGGDTQKRHSGRHGFGGKMHRLLHLKAASGAADAPSSPGRSRSPLLFRSVEFLTGDHHHAGNGDGAMRASAPDTPPSSKTALGNAAAVGGAAAALPGRNASKSLWGKLGSGMKGRKGSPATLAARNSFEGSSAVELPFPSNGSSSAAMCPSAGNLALCSGDDMAYAPRSESDADEDGEMGDGGSFCSESPGPAGMAATPFAPRDVYCDETLDLRQAVNVGYAGTTPPSMPGGMEAMPDYLLTPGMQGILGASGPHGVVASPDTAEAKGPAAAEAWRGEAYHDADATVALLPAAQLAQAGYSVDATMALFSSPIPEVKTPVAAGRVTSTESMADEPHVMQDVDAPVPADAAPPAAVTEASAVVEAPVAAALGTVEPQASEFELEQAPGAAEACDMEGGIGPVPLVAPLQSAPFQTAAAATVEANEECAMIKAASEPEREAARITAPAAANQAGAQADAAGSDLAAAGCTAVEAADAVAGVEEPEVPLGVEEPEVPLGVEEPEVPLAAVASPVEASAIEGAELPGAEEDATEQAAPLTGGEHLVAAEAESAAADVQPAAEAVGAAAGKEQTGVQAGVVVQPSAVDLTEDTMPVPEAMADAPSNAVAPEAPEAAALEQAEAQMLVQDASNGAPIAAPIVGSVAAAEGSRMDQDLQETAATASTAVEHGKDAATLLPAPELAAVSPEAAAYVAAEAEAVPAGAAAQEVEQECPEMVEVAAGQPVEAACEAEAVDDVAASAEVAATWVTPPAVVDNAADVEDVTVEFPAAAAMDAPAAAQPSDTEAEADVLSEQEVRLEEVQVQVAEHTEQRAPAAVGAAPQPHQPPQLHVEVERTETPDVSAFSGPDSTAAGIDVSRTEPPSPSPSPPLPLPPSQSPPASSPASDAAPLATPPGAAAADEDPGRLQRDSDDDDIAAEEDDILMDLPVCEEPQFATSESPNPQDRRGSGSASGRSHGHGVRESIPLFVLQSGGLDLGLGGGAPGAGDEDEVDDFLALGDDAVVGGDEDAALGKEEQQQQHEQLEDQGAKCGVSNGAAGGRHPLGGGAQRVQARAGAEATHGEEGGFTTHLEVAEEGRLESPASLGLGSPPLSPMQPPATTVIAPASSGALSPCSPGSHSLASAVLSSPAISPLQPRRISGSPGRLSPVNFPGQGATPQQHHQPLAFDRSGPSAATPDSTPKLAGAGARTARRSPTGAAASAALGAAQAPSSFTMRLGGAAAAAPGSVGDASPTFFTPGGGAQSPASAAAKVAAVEAAVAAAHANAGAFGSPASGFASPLEARPAGGPACAVAGSPTLALGDVGGSALATLSAGDLLGPGRMPAPGARPRDSGALAAYGQVSTPTVNLLDHSAMSPSAVYHARLAGTPFVRAAAANVDAARHAPLVDSSPCDLGDMDTMVFREDLEKVCQNLSADSPAGRGAAEAKTPAAAAASIKAAAAPGGSSSPGAAEGSGGGGGGGVADALLTAQLRVMTQKAAGFERQLRQAQLENEQLKEQLATLEFEKTELGQQDEFEREARLFAEEQLAAAQREMAAHRQQVAAHQQLLSDARAELHKQQQDRAAAEAVWVQERAELEAKVQQASSDRDAALDRLNFQDMRLTALGGANCELQTALQAEKERAEQLARQLAAKDQDLARITQELAESQAQTEKAVEQVCSANMAIEQAVSKAQHERERLDEALAQLAAQAGAAAERERLLVQAQHYQLLKHKYTQKSAALKEALARVAAKEAENGELMAMCDQLLAQQEAARCRDTIAGHDQQ